MQNPGILHSLFFVAIAHLKYYMLTSVFAATMACISYPSGISALVPGINMHGHRNRLVTTAKGVLFFPYILAAVFEKKR